MLMTWLGVKQGDLTEREEENKRYWIKEHSKICSNPVFYIEQSRCSGIGIATTVGCLLCNEEENITDYEMW